MPSLPAVPGVLKTRLLWSDDADHNVSTTNYWKYSGSAPDAGTCLTLAQACYGSFGAYEHNWSADVQLIGCEATDLSTTMGGQNTYSQSVPGNLEPPALAGSTCVLVNYQIERRYRGGKPRNYFPWGAAGTLNGRQAWLAAFVSQVQADVTAAIDNYIGTSAGSTTIVQHVNVSYYEGFTTFTTPSGRVKNLSKLRAGGPQVDTIVSASVNVTPSSQRRRNRP